MNFDLTQHPQYQINWKCKILGEENWSSRREYLRSYNALLFQMDPNFCHFLKLCFVHIFEYSGKGLLSNS